MDAALGQVRPLTADDVDTVVEMTRLCDLAETGVVDDDLIDWLHDSGLDGYAAFGSFDQSGLAAFGWVECKPGAIGLEGDLRVRPGVDPAAAGPVLAELQAAARAYDANKPLHFFVNRQTASMRRWLETMGAYEIRRFWRMAIELDEQQPPQPPVLPPEVTIRRVRDQELRVIWSLVEESFAEHFGHAEGRTYDEWLDRWRKRSGFDPSLWWVAELDGAPVAVLLALTVGAGDVAGHISTVGTLKAARGRGLGTTLLVTAFAEFHRRGIRRVTLGVDAANETGAVRLYESVGMRVEQDWVLYELPTAESA